MKKVLTLSMALIIVAGVVSLARSANIDTGTGWSSSTGYSKDRLVVKTSNGTIVVLYRRSSSPSGIRAKKSTDNGANWTDLAGVSGQSTLVDSAYYGDYSICLDASDNIYVAYQDSADIYFRKLTYSVSGSSWTVGLERGVQDDGSSDGPSVIRQSNGRIWIAYGYDIDTDGIVKTKYSDYDFDPSQSIVEKDVGSWQSGASAGNYYPALVLRNDNPFLIYADENTGQDKYKWSSYIVSGSSWSTPSDISTDGAVDYQFSVTTIGNDVHFVYRHSGIGIKHRYYNGTSWSEPSTLSSSYYDWYPSLTTGDNSLWCFISEYVASNQYNIMYKKWSSGTWDSNWTAITTDNANNRYCTSPSTTTAYIPIAWTEGTASYTVKFDSSVYADTTAPGPPTDVTANPSGWTATNSFGFSWTAPSDASGINHYHYSVNSTPTSGSPSTTSTSLAAYAAATQQGANTFYVVAEDNAGNVNYSNYGTCTFYYDSTAPTTPGTPSTTTPTSNTKPTWTWTASTDAHSGLRTTDTYIIYWDTVAGGTANSAYSNTNSYTHTVDLAQGTWYAKVRAYDAVNNPSEFSGNGSVVIDATAPAAITDLTGLCDGQTGDVTLTWSTPGDDGWNNTLPNGSGYRIDYSSVTKTWDKDDYEVGIPTNGVAPHTQVSYTVTDLQQSTTWYFQIWTRDEVPNWSGLSNGCTVWIPVPAQTYNWTGGGAYGVWTDTSNWDVGGSYPDDANDKAVINTGSESISTPSGSALTIGELVLGSSYSGALTLGNNLTLDDSGIWDANLTISANATLNLAGKNLTLETGSTFSNSGTLKLQGDETVSNKDPTNNSGSTVEYTATSGSRAIKNWTYHHLKINGSGGTFTVGAGETLGGDLTIAAGTFNLNGQIVDVTGNFLKSGGTLYMYSSNDELDIAGDFTVTGGTADITASGADIYIGGDIDISGDNSFNPSNGYYYMDGAGNATVSITGANNDLGFGTGAYFYVSKTNSTDTVQLLTDMASHHFLHTEGIFDVNGHNASFDGVYYGYSGSKLQMSSGTFRCGQNGYSGGIYSPWWVGSGWTENISGGTITVYGGKHATYGTAHFANGSNFTPTGGTFELVGTDASSIYIAEVDDADFNFYNLTIGDGTNAKTVDMDASSQILDVDGNLTIKTNATFDTSGKAVDVAGSVDIDDTFTANNSAITVGGNWDSSGGTFNYNTSTVTFNGTAQTISGAITFYHLEVKSSSQLDINDVTVSCYDLTVQANKKLRLNSASDALTATDSVYNYGTIEQTNGTVNINDTGGDYEGLFNYSGSTYTISGGALNILRSLTNFGGTLNISGSAVVDVDRYFYNYDGYNSTINMSGGAVDCYAFPNYQGSVNHSGGTITSSTYYREFDSGGGNYYGSGTALLKVTTYLRLMKTGTYFNDLEIIGSSAYIDTDSTQSLDINGDFSIGSGKAFDTNGTDMYVGGDWSNSGTFTADSNTVTFDAGASGKTITSNGQPFYDIVFSNASGGWTLEDSLDVDGDLTISAGTFDTKSGENNPIYVAGDWKYEGGTFECRQSTVTFDNASSTSTLTGSTTFYGLVSTASGKNIKFSSNTVTYVTGHLNFENITLRSTTNGATWYLTLSGTQDVDSVDVQDSNASGGNTIIAYNSTNSGNNTNWDFGPPAAITDLTGLCDGQTGNVTLTWSTPGDDGWTGTLVDGSKYRIDYSSYSIAWSTMTFDVDIPTHSVAPHTEVSYEITDLTEDTTWYFRIWTADEVSRWSGLSNGATVWVTITVSSYTYTWTDSAANGTWTDQTNWNIGDGSPGNDGYPDDANDKAVINTSTRTINTPAGNALTIGELELSGSYTGTLTLGNNLTLENSGPCDGNLTISSGKITDNGRTVTVNGNISIVDVSGRLSSSGLWIQGANGNISNPNSSNIFNTLQIANNVISTRTGHVRTKKIILGTNATLQGTLGELIIAPTANDFIDMATGSQVTGNRIWISLPNSPPLTQKAFSALVSVVIAYGKSSTIKMTGDWTIGTTGGSLRIWGTYDADTEAEALVLDTNGYNLTVNGWLELGYSDVNYKNCYQVKVLFSTGTHSISGNVFVDNTPARYTYVYFNLGSADISIAGNVNFSSSTVTAGTSTVTLDGTSGTQTVTSWSQSFYHLKIDNAGTSVQLQDVADIDGGLNVTTGTLNLNGYNITVSSDVSISGSGSLTCSSGEQITVGGNWSASSGATFTAANSTTTFNGSGSFNILSSGTTFYNLAFSNSVSTWTLTDALYSAGDFTITNSSGNVNSNGKDVTIAGDFKINGGKFTAGASTIEVGGDWDSSGGTFNYNTSTVTFYGTGTSTSTLTGSTTFYGLVSTITGKTVKLASGTTTYVTGHLNFENITLRSTTNGATWYLNLSGTQDVDSVDVRDSNASGGNTVIAFDCTDSGNNTNWDFGPPAAITDLTGLCDSQTGDVTLSWSTPGDDGWTGTLVDGSKYRIDYSSYSIAWSTTTYDVEIPTHSVAPHTQVSHTITGLTGDTTWYFQIWTADEVSRWSGLSNGATVYVNPILSIDITPSTRPFGTVPATQSDVLDNGFTVTNTGNTTEKYQLRLTGVPTGWTAKNVVGAPGWEEVKILGLFTTQSPLSASHFNDNPPNTGDGDIVRSSSNDTATSTNFAISTEGAGVKGYNVGKGGIRYLWFRFDAPSGTTLTSQQFLTVTVTAIQQ